MHMYNTDSWDYFLWFPGLSNKKLKRYDDALDSFYKLHNILRNSAQVIYQIADMYPLKTIHFYCLYYKTIGLGINQIFPIGITA